MYAMYGHGDACGSDCQVQLSSVSYKKSNTSLMQPRPFRFVVYLNSGYDASNTDELATGFWDHHYILSVAIDQTSQKVEAVDVSLLTSYLIVVRRRGRRPI